MLKKYRTAVHLYGAEQDAITVDVHNVIAAAKEEQRRSPTWLGHCSGCTDPHSEGTHQMGTIEHPDLDNAKGSGLTVDGAIRTLKDTLKWGEYTGSMVLDWLLEDEPSIDGMDIEESLRKALEDLAENSRDNLRTDQWVSVEDRLPSDKASTNMVLAYDEFYRTIGLAYHNGSRLVLSDSDDCSVTHWMPLPAPPDNTDKG